MLWLELILNNFESLSNIKFQTETPTVRSYNLKSRKNLERRRKISSKQTKS